MFHSATAKLSGARRLASGGSTGVGSTSTFRQDWLSDPSTYPIIVILGVAITGAFGFISYKIAYCPNVRITSKAKGQLLRTWA